MYKGWTEKRNQEKKMKELLKDMEKWDFKFEYESKQAVIWLAFEFSLASYFQESKIDNVDVRRAIHSNIIFDNFMYSEIKAWTKEDNPKREWCRIEELGNDNNCHEFLAFVFIRAIDDVIKRIGPFPFNWKLMYF